MNKNGIYFLKITWKTIGNLLRNEQCISCVCWLFEPSAINIFLGFQPRCGIEQLIWRTRHGGRGRLLILSSVQHWTDFIWAHLQARFISRPHSNFPLCFLYSTLFWLWWVHMYYWNVNPKMRSSSWDQIEMNYIEKEKN